MAYLDKDGLDLLIRKIKVELKANADEINKIIQGAPEELDTLKELADYLKDSSVEGGIVKQLAGKADKSATVSTVAYDSTNKKLTKTINGTTTDVVTAATLKSAMSLNNVNNTSDANKPISTATQTALNNKSDIGHTHTQSEITDFPTSMTPKSHTHGNITNDGLVGTAANKPLITTTGGKVTTGSFGTAANTFCQGNDSRLSDSRTPKAHTHTKSDISDFPKSLPASDVYSWAKAETKPSYTASEVGALANTVTHLSGDVPTTRKVNGHALSADVTVSKSDVGLGSVANTGDSATPVSGGTTKFTTGGAYTELNKKVDKVTGKGLSTNDYTDTDKASITYYGTCSTSRATNAKVVACDNFELKTGCKIVVKFTDTAGAAPTSGNITMNVNSKGAKNVYNKNGGQMTYSSSGEFRNNRYCEFVYDGTNFVWLNYDSNTTYTLITQAEITAGTSTSSRLVTPKLLADNFKTTAITDEEIETLWNNADIAQNG